MSWIEAWREGRVPWDAGQSPPILEKLVEAGELPEGRALVPGCGSGYDVLTLASEERSVLGIDLADGAAERFDRLRREAGIAEERADVVTGDFFDHDFGGPFDLVWDYTFLCALPPDRRGEWAERMHELVKPSGELVTLIFPVRDPEMPPDAPEAADEEAGPPYPLSPPLVEAVVGDLFERVELFEVEESNGERAGLEWLARWRPVGNAGS